MERGDRRLDVIELYDWLDALHVKVVDFLDAYESELRRSGIVPVSGETTKVLGAKEAKDEVSAGLAALAAAARADK